MSNGAYTISVLCVANHPPEYTWYGQPAVKMTVFFFHCAINSGLYIIFQYLVMNLFLQTKVIYITVTLGGPGSSVGIATDYGLDGPGSNPGGDEIFRSSRPALGPTQPPVKWVLGLSRG